MANFSLLFVLTAIILSSQLGFPQGSTIHFPSKSSLNGTEADPPEIQIFELPSGVTVHAVLLTVADPEIYGNFFAFAFGVYSSIYDPGNSLLAVVLLEATNGSVRTDRPAQVVWAYGGESMPDNTTVDAEQGKGLALINFDSLEVWSTNILGYESSGLLLTGEGNLVIYSINGSIFWRSFDNPTNALLIGQALKEQQKLFRMAAPIVSNITCNLYASIASQSLTGFVQYDKPVAYLSVAPAGPLDKRAKLKIVEFQRGGKIIFGYEMENVSFYRNMSIYVTMPINVIAAQLLIFDHDGGLRVYVWELLKGWKPVELGFRGHDRCQSPLVCGVYGVCTEGECTCPTGSDGIQYFTPISSKSPGSGCQFAGVSDVNSKSYKYHLVDFGNLSYFGYFDPNAATVGLSALDTCKEACDTDAVCKAAFFRYGTNASEGLCYLLSEVLSLRDEQIPGPMNSSVAFIKVPPVASATASPPPPPPPLPRSSSPPQYGMGVILRFLSIRNVASIVIPLIICAIISSVIWTKIKRKRCISSDCFEQALRAPRRFSYKELRQATRKFSMRIGRGGFGTVFKGELKDGTLIAVKRLDCMDQGMCEFLAEMKTIGSVHHVNLVKLLGFCAEESNRMLVYEFVSNGSLDKWIFTSRVVSWETRRRIILDIARGLAYLHEECSQRIAHLDMKPHNVLLDENFSAKISDFGLARLIDRNQSHVTTGMRGTLGYLAPEWQHSRITVKADVYSFGIIVLEVASGRRNLDYSQRDSDISLPSIFQRKAREGRLLDIVDEKIEDLECYGGDILKVLTIGAWCLNEDPSNRPTMSAAVRVLEGSLEIEHSIEFKFGNVPLFSCKS